MITASVQTQADLQPTSTWLLLACFILAGFGICLAVALSRWANSKDAETEPLEQSSHVRVLEGRGE